MEHDENIKSNILNLIEQKVRNSVELVGTGKGILNRTLGAQALSSTVNKCDLMALKSYCVCSKKPSFQQSSRQQNGKRSLPIAHCIEG